MKTFECVAHSGNTEILKNCTSKKDTFSLEIKKRELNADVHSTLVKTNFM